MQFVCVLKSTSKCTTLTLVCMFQLNIISGTLLMTSNHSRHYKKVIAGVP